MSAYLWPPIVEVGKPTRFFVVSPHPVLSMELDGVLYGVVPSGEPAFWRLVSAATINPPETHIAVIHTSEGDREEPIDGFDQCPTDVVAAGSRLFTQADSIVSTLAAAGAMSTGASTAMRAILRAGGAQWQAGRFRAGLARQEALIHRAFAEGSGDLMEITLDISSRVRYLTTCGTGEVLRVAISCGVRVDFVEGGPGGRSLAVGHDQNKLQQFASVAMPPFPPATQLPLRATKETATFMGSNGYGPIVGHLFTGGLLGTVDIPIPAPAGRVDPDLPPGGVGIGHIWNSITGQVEVVTPDGWPLFGVNIVGAIGSSAYGVDWIGAPSSFGEFLDALGVPPSFPVFYFSAHALADFSGGVGIPGWENVYSGYHSPR